MLGEKIQKILEIIMRDRIILTILNFPAKKNRVNLHWAPIFEKNGIVSIGRKERNYRILGTILQLQFMNI